MTFDPAALAAPFSSGDIHWRAQTLNREGTSAMALAYIDARHVMRRLDEVCGPANWQDSYTETVKGRLICTLSLRIGDGWISKSDGAGDTDVEGEKGAISDALKRAAVKWGVGRYLYDMPNTWADCESYEANGKKRWKKWTDAGLRKLAGVRAPTGAPIAAVVISDAQYAELVTLVQSTNSDTTAMLEHYSVVALNQLTVPQWEDAKARLIKRLPQKKAA